MENDKGGMKSKEPKGNQVYPRTGKRGVPQQFPRRLYHMLETEASEHKTDKDRLISWSTSGTAFMIEDSLLFSSLVLPKYFKTNVFSSFQRNMNLYGFTKLRKGPEAGMYYHPDFVRGKPENLYKLTKCKTASERKLSLGGAAPSNISELSDSNIMNRNNKSSTHIPGFSHGPTQGGHLSTQSPYGNTNGPIVPERSAAAAQFAARANANAGRFKNPHLSHEQAYMYHMHNRIPYPPAYGQPYNRPAPPFGAPYYPLAHASAPGSNMPTSAAPFPYPYAPQQGYHHHHHHPYPSNVQYPTGNINIDKAAKQNQVPSLNSSNGTDYDAKSLQDSKVEGNLMRSTSQSSLPKNDETSRNEDSEDSSKMKGLLTLAMTCLSDGKK